MSTKNQWCSSSTTGSTTSFASSKVYTAKTSCRTSEAKTPTSKKRNKICFKSDCITKYPTYHRERINIASYLAHWISQTKQLLSLMHILQTAQVKICINMSLTFRITMFCYRHMQRIHSLTVVLHKSMLQFRQLFPRLKTLLQRRLLFLISINMRRPRLFYCSQTS
mgnify:CR=1 FL=1